MSRQGLRDAVPCPACALGGTLRLETTSEADLVEGHTVVVHRVPTLVCDRCGVELYDEPTTRLLEEFHQHGAKDRAHTLVVDFERLRSRAVS